MVRKVSNYVHFALSKVLIGLSCLAVVCAICTTTARADTLTVFDGTIGTNYQTYFKDILSNVSILDDYVFFREDQYTYTMVVGDLEFDGSAFHGYDDCTVYTIDTRTYTGQNNYNRYDVSYIGGLYLKPTDHLLYSNLGDFPQLENRGDKYEYIQTITVVVIGLCFILRSILGTSSRTRY